MIMSCSEVFHRFHNDLFGICVFGKGVIKSVTAFEIERGAWIIPYAADASVINQFVKNNFLCL